MAIQKVAWSVVTHVSAALDLSTSELAMWALEHLEVSTLQGNTVVAPTAASLQQSLDSNAQFRARILSLFAQSHSAVIAETKAQEASHPVLEGDDPTDRKY